MFTFLCRPVGLDPVRTMPYNKNDMSLRKTGGEKGCGGVKDGMTAQAMHKQYSDGVTAFRQHIAVEMARRCLIESIKLAGGVMA